MNKKATRLDIRSGLIGFTMGVVTAGAVVVGLAKYSLEQTQDSSISDSQNDSTTDTAGALGQGNNAQTAPHRAWKTDDFIVHVYGKTKAQVRAEFGSPDNFDSASNTWFYWHLDITDSQAGTPVRNTAIEFAEIGGDYDTVNDVRFD